MSFDNQTTLYIFFTGISGFDFNCVWSFINQLFFEGFDEVINAFIAAMPEGHGYKVNISGEPGNQTLTFDNPQGLSTVADVISEGFELELVYNVTDSWRIAFNAAF